MTLKEMKNCIWKTLEKTSKKKINSTKTQTIKTLKQVKKLEIGLKQNSF